MDGVSNTVLLRMIEYLQGELDAQSVRLQQLERINDAQAGVIRTLRQDLTDSQETTSRIAQGSEIVLRGLDVIYNHTKRMFEEGRMEFADWDEIYRGMLRADIGFAILNGAPYVDLTAEDTEIESVGEEIDDGEETETDDEMEVTVYETVTVHIEGGARSD